MLLIVYAQWCVLTPAQIVRKNARFLYMYSRLEQNMQNAHAFVCQKKPFVRHSEIFARVLMTCF